MRFHVGQLVWIGYVPDDRCGDAGHARCQYGTIMAGPFAPGKLLAARAWQVKPREGQMVDAAESLLRPLDDPGDTEVDFEKLLFGVET